MVELLDLWLPIVVSAVAVWIASALAWTALPHHKGDFRSLADENAVMDVVRRQNLQPGVYGYPDCLDKSRMKDPEFQKKLKEGPLGMLHVWPSNSYSNMGAKMGWSFVFYLVTSVVVAYLATLGVPVEATGDRLLAGAAGPGFLHVFRFVGTAAFLAYCFARIPNDIWFNTPRTSKITNFIDGVVYALITGAIFGWLWPGS